MPNSQIIKNSLLNSLAALAYISLVALFFNNASAVFGEKDTIFSGIAALLLFVTSATIMGIIVLGRPILWYLDGLKKEAVKLLITTVGFLFLFLILILSTMLIAAKL